MGIGFAISTKLARNVLDAILKEGRVVRGFLGVALQDLTPQLAESFGYKGTKGAVVTSVEPGSPAAKAGLKEGDIIVSLNGAPVENGVQLKNLVASLRPGTRVEMEFFRGGRTETLTAQVAELKSPTPPHQERETSGKLGMAVKTLTPELAAQLGQREDLTGVAVASVEPGGLADKAGLQPRDIILAVGDQKVNDVTEFQRELEKHDLKRGLRMQVRRGPANLYVFVGAQAG
jgi:serine protease Do